MRSINFSSSPGNQPDAGNLRGVMIKTVGCQLVKYPQQSQEDRSVSCLSHVGHTLEIVTAYPSSCDLSNQGVSVGFGIRMSQQSHM